MSMHRPMYPEFYDDERILSNWRIIQRYPKYRAELIELAKIVYMVTCNILHKKPETNECIDLYKKALIHSNTFKDIIDSTLWIRLKPRLSYEIALRLSRWIIAKDWQDISVTPCP